MNKYDQTPVSVRDMGTVEGGPGKASLRRPRLERAQSAGGTGGDGATEQSERSGEDGRGPATAGPASCREGFGFTVTLCSFHSGWAGTLQRSLPPALC